MAAWGLAPGCTKDSLPGDPAQTLTTVYLRAEWKSRHQGSGERDLICSKTEHRFNASADSRVVMVKLFKSSEFMSVVLDPLMQQIQAKELGWPDLGRAAADQVQG